MSDNNEFEDKKKNEAASGGGGEIMTSVQQGPYQGPQQQGIQGMPQQGMPLYGQFHYPSLAPPSLAPLQGPQGFYNNALYGFPQGQGMPPQGFQPPPYGQFSFPQGPTPYFPYPPNDNKMIPYPQAFPVDPYGAPQAEPQSNDAERVYFTPTDEQLENLKDRLRNKYRSNMPFDWLGQLDNQWYSSWLLSQPNFVAFRLFLATFTYYCWNKFHGQVAGDNWNHVAEPLLDSTTPTRFCFVWVSLFVVMIGTGAVALLSTLQMILAPERFAKLTAYRLGTNYLGKWRAWLNFRINAFYDAGPIMACVPLILNFVPSQFFITELKLPLWTSLALPLLVLMDWWICKRTRFDGTTVRRYSYITILFLFLAGVAWLFGHFLGIRVLLAFYDKSFINVDVFPLLLLNWGYFVLVSVGVDAMYNFCRFKANNLLTFHFDKLSSRDVNEIAADYEAYYTKKNEELRARLEAEQAEILASMETDIGSNKSVDTDNSEDGSINDELKPSEFDEKEKEPEPEPDSAYSGSNDYSNE